MKDRYGRWAAVFAAAHIAASFWYEPVVFGFAGLTALKSGSFGSIATLAASKLVGVLLIVLFWRAVFRMIAGKYPKKALISFFALFPVSLTVIAIVYPQNYAYATDNLLIYRQAIAYQPAYWHHYLTGSFFAGCYMFLPHPVSLMLVQSAFFCVLIASLFSRLSDRFGAGHAWPMFFLLLVPAIYYVQFSPYRNCLFAILCMFACSELLLFWLDGNAPLTRQIRLAAAFSMIAVWRSEGILLFALLPLGLWLACHGSFRRVLLLTAASAAAAVAIALPQSIGMAQEGQTGDYKIISTMSALQDIYNADDLSLRYAGGTEDAAIVESFVPRALLQEYGLEGYRACNTADGRNINDSGQPEERVDAFLSAYARIVLHNLPAFIRSQGNRFLDALKFPEVFRKSEYSGMHTELPKAAVASTSANMQEDTLFELTQGAFWRAKSGTAMDEREESLRAQAGSWLYLYDAKTRRASILVRAALPFVALTLGIVAGRRKKSLFPVLMLLIFAAELGAVVFMAPGAYTAYYYPLLFCGYLFVLILASFCSAGRKKKRLVRMHGETE
jgi:hypothetical protein